ncbi:VIT1/CCC1 transporter family protein [Methanolacinia paynteri]|uniref:VIT1/CCC1 transporter family protein n=1 Tax=Methanolacinia paynteri TaxID=230356 RepID=UPI00064F5E01|nr:VIT1/CCC1 transporter family protein [Methanolacinia paynteri]
MESGFSKDISGILDHFQKNEITEHQIYEKLAEREKDPHNKEVLGRIAGDELKHYNIIKKLTGKEFSPDKRRILWFTAMARVFGLTFTIKLMEKGEKRAQSGYSEIKEKFPEISRILADEERHELELADMINEEKLGYMGSVVLGLNDALVELTGALAGFSFALQNTALIGAIGLITGIAAALSMAASEYLSEKADGGGEKDPFRAASYTGAAYILTVFLLILPYFIFGNYAVALAVAIITGIIIIFVFNFYISVAKDLNFKRRFLEMAAISLGVAGLSFVLGAVVKIVFGVDI